MALNAFTYNIILASKNFLCLISPSAAEAIVLVYPSRFPLSAFSLNHTFAHLSRVAVKAADGRAGRGCLPEIERAR